MWPSPGPPSASASSTKETCPKPYPAWVPADFSSALLTPLLPKPLNHCPSIGLTDLDQIGSHLLAALPLIDCGGALPGEVPPEGLVQTSLRCRCTPSEPGGLGGCVAGPQDRVVHDVVRQASTCPSFLYGSMSKAP